MHRLTRLLILGIFTMAWLGCGTPPEPIAATTAPLYVDAVSGGHGPFPCSGAIPARGYVDIFDGWSPYSGNCQRWRGDMADGTGYQHLGFLVHPAMWVTSMRVSPRGTDVTRADVCAGQAALPSGCDGNGGFNTTADVPAMGFAPTTLRIQYTSWCPATAAFKHLRQGTGANALFDAGNRAAVVITDDFGHPLYEPNGTSLATDCATWMTPVLAAQFTPPPGYLYGIEVAAVYTQP